MIRSATSPHAGLLEPDALPALAAALADGVRYVQGAGGNLSVKHDGVLWVKASGTRFADAGARRIFVAMDLERARSRALLDEDLRAAVLQVSGLEGLRPSIEAAFHALMPQRVVVHVHSVGAVAAAVGDPAHALDRVRGEFVPLIVPYRRPGLPLAKALAESGAATDAPEAVVLLANHGLLVAAPAAERALELVQRVEQVLAPGGLPLPEDATTRARGYVRLFPGGTLAPSARDVLLGGVLTPDSAVFLGPRPFVAEHGEHGTCILPDDGSVWVPSAASRDAIEVVHSLVAVARHADGATRYLRPPDVDELVDWDAEKWRQEQQR